MWTYNKILQYPVNIKQRDPRLAKWIISQYGGPDTVLILLRKYVNNYLLKFYKKRKDVYTIRIKKLNDWI